MAAECGGSYALTTRAGAEIPNWPSYPTLYEINTWAWLSELSEKDGRPVNLDSVPSTEWDAIAAGGFEAGPRRSVVCQYGDPTLSSW